MAAIRHHPLGRDGGARHSLGYDVSIYWQPDWLAEGMLAEDAVIADLLADEDDALADIRRLEGLR